MDFFLFFFNIQDCLKKNKNDLDTIYMTLCASLISWTASLFAPVRRASC